MEVKTLVDLCPDDMDNHIISTAIDGEADYIVNGDKKDFLPITGVSRAEAEKESKR